MQSLVFNIAVLGLVEEVIFRGYLYVKLKNVSPTIVAIIISSALFSLVHFPSIFLGETPIGIPYLVNAMLFGVVSCLLIEKLKGCSLLSIIIAHGVHNAILYGILLTNG